MSTDNTEISEDELLRQALDQATSGVNEGDEQGEEVIDNEEEAPNESDDETPPEASSESKEEEVPKKKWIAKILAQRNAYKRELEELKSNAWTNREDDVKFIEKQSQASAEDVVRRVLFFRDNPEAEEMREELEELAQELWGLSIEKAYKYYLAETDPSKLLDEQTQNKLNSKKYSSAWHSPQSLRQEKKLDYTSAEFDRLLTSGKIRV